MCPVCITTAALIVGGTASTGGLIALVFTKLFAKNVATDVPTLTNSEENHDGK